MKNTQVRFLRCGFALVFAVLAGCMAGIRNEDSSVLRTRAVERWNFLIAHQAEKAYDYLSPGFRETKPKDVYAKEMNNRPVNWQSVKYVDQQCEQDSCEVNLEITFQVVVNAGGMRRVQTHTPMQERWVRTEGKWYFLPDSRLKPTAVPPATH